MTLIFFQFIWKFESVGIYSCTRLGTHYLNQTRPECWLVSIWCFKTFFCKHVYEHCQCSLNFHRWWFNNLGLAYAYNIYIYADLLIILLWMERQKSFLSHDFSDSQKISVNLYGRNWDMVPSKIKHRMLSNND